MLYADSFEVCKLFYAVKILLCLLVHPDQLNQWCKFCLTNDRCGMFGRKNCFETKVLQFCFWRLERFILICKQKRLSFCQIFSVLSAIHYGGRYILYLKTHCWLILPEPSSVPATCQSHQVPCRQASWGRISVHILTGIKMLLS